MTIELWCYEACPIDCWTGALSRSQMEASLIADRDGCDAREEAQGAQKMLDAIVEVSEAIFVLLGWEGDHRHDPEFFAMPCGNSMGIGYIVKQDNNGTCFVASPSKLHPSSLECPVGPIHVVVNTECQP